MITADIWSLTGCVRPMLAVAGLLLLESSQIAWAQGQPRPAVPVVVSKVIEEQVHSGQEYVGTIIPSRMATIGSAVDGRVIKFPVNEGDRVKADSTLAQLLTETINMELRSAESELTLRKQELAELVNGTRPEEIEQAKARVEASESSLNYAKANYERVEGLLTRQAINEDQYQLVRAQYFEAKATHDERRSAYEQAVNGPRKETIAQYQARVDVQDAIVRQLEDKIKKHTIVTRFDGYVTKEHTEQGMWVKQGDPVADVAALDEVLIDTQVLESHVSYIELGQVVKVTIPALAGEVFLGKVKHIVPQADIRTRTFPVKVEVSNKFVGDQPVLKAGMLARVVLPTGPSHLAKMVPKDAVVLGGKQPTVLIATPMSDGDSTASVLRIPVVLGVAKGSYVQVEGDLKPDQLVITKGNERIRPDQDVKIAQEDNYDRNGPTVTEEPSSEEAAAQNEVPSVSTTTGPAS